MTETRRPIRSRQSLWAQAATEWLVASDVRPNAISQASIVFAALAFLLFWAASAVGGAFGMIFLLIGAAACQARLICNLLDGMVAETSGATPDGLFWNEAPDRLSDLLILTGFGLAAGWPMLGILAASLAIGTAYLRELGRAEGQPPDFAGPFAKPQRMAAVILGAILAVLEAAFFGSSIVLPLALFLIVIGTAATCVRRSLRIIEQLNARGR